MPPVARPWFRMYSSVLTNSKVQSLRGREALVWINLLALANLQRPRGTLPNLGEVAFQLRMSIKSLDLMLNDFADIGLIDDLGDNKLVIHDWAEWQKDRDVTERYRDVRHANVTVSVEKITLDREKEKEKEKDKEKEKNKTKNALSRGSLPAPVVLTPENFPYRRFTDAHVKSHDNGAGGVEPAAAVDTGPVAYRVRRLDQRRPGLSGT